MSAADRQDTLDGIEELAEYEVGGTHVSRYSHDPSRVDAVLAQTAVSGTTHYAVADALGSVYALTDGEGTTRTRYEYDAYGARSTSVEGVATKWGFTGRVHEAGVPGAMYYRRRILDTDVGRFTNTDPTYSIRAAASRTVPPQPYLYASSSPVKRTDPSGLIDINFAGGFLGYSEHPGISASGGFAFGPIDLSSEISEAAIVYVAVNKVRERMSVDYRCKLAFTQAKSKGCDAVPDGTALDILNNTVVYRLYNWEAISDLVSDPQSGTVEIPYGAAALDIPRPPYVVGYATGALRNSTALAAVLIHEMAHHAGGPGHAKPGPDFVVRGCGFVPWYPGAD